MVSFDHREPSRAAGIWRHNRRTLDPLPSTHLGELLLIVISAHPDDEVLGAAGLIHTCLSSGGAVETVLATAGEAAAPGTDDAAKTALGELRLREYEAALAALTPGGRIGPNGLSERAFLGFPDRGLAEHSEELGRALAAAVANARKRHQNREAVLVGPFRRDGHADHDSLGRAAARLAQRESLALLEFPIWWWHWAAPEDTSEPWRSWQRLDLSDEQCEAKQQAIEVYSSQLEDVGDGTGPILNQSFLGNFLDGSEVFAATLPAEHSALRTSAHYSATDAPAVCLRRCASGGPGPLGLPDQLVRGT